MCWSGRICMHFDNILWSLAEVDCINQKFVYVQSILKAVCWLPNSCLACNVIFSANTIAFMS